MNMTFLGHVASQLDLLHPPSKPINQTPTLSTPGTSMTIIVDIMNKSSLFFIRKQEVSLRQPHCLKRRTKREKKDAQSITTKNSSPVAHGVRLPCDTEMSRIQSIKWLPIHDTSFSQGVDFTSRGWGPACLYEAGGQINVPSQ